MYLDMDSWLGMEVLRRHSTHADRTWLRTVLAATSFTNAVPTARCVVLFLLALLELESHTR